MNDQNNKDFNEAFDELAKSYEDPSKAEPSFDDFLSEPEDPSEEENVVSQNDDDEVQPAEELEQEQEAPVQNEQQTTELPLNYKELYEKAKRDAEAQNALWASRLTDLSHKYQELKEVKNAPAQTKEDPDELPEYVKELFEIHPEIANAVKTLVDTKVSAVKKNVETELKTRVEPIQQQIFQSEADKHFSTIRAAHPDISAILDSGDLFTWINSLPPVMQNGAKYVYQYGTAQEVISLLDDYKSARGVNKPQMTRASSPRVQTNPASETEDIVKQVLAAMAVRTGKEPIDISNKPKAKPREKSFDELAREYERSRRTR